jgi:tetratricopeptide (TPR) repeat protein
MLRLSFLAALLLAAALPLRSLGADDANEAGQRGNEAYEQGDYAAAEDAYRAGLAALADSSGATYVALQNNLGMALHQQQRHGEARAAFEAAARRAAASNVRAQALYNAGVSAAVSGELSRALVFFRDALLADPAHENARFNYELVARELSRRRDEQKRRQPPEERPEPSAFARRLKARAEAMAAQRRYAAARALMQRGLRDDSTVAAYRTFITRLGEIVEIQTPDSLRPGATIR